MWAPEAGWCPIAVARPKRWGGQAVASSKTGHLPRPTDPGVRSGCVAGVKIGHSFGAALDARDTARAMSQENVEIVRSIVAAWERGDFSSAEWAHPGIGFVNADGPTPGSWTGVAAMAEAWREGLRAFEELRVEADECRALDDERVLVLMHFSGRGKASGLELGDIQMKGANLFHVRGGKVTRLVTYWDRERAFADLGLGE
jgi:ketosteroid isomerase-like protein